MRKLLLTVMLLGSAAPVWAAGDKDAEHRNVVLVVLDDLGRDAGCYGNALVQTPHLDALAADGVRFERAFCTTASCSASRSVILSGLYNHANGQYGLAHGDHNFRSLPSVRGLPVLLAEAGYRTCSIGKVHVLPEECYHFEQTANDGTQSSRNSVRMAELARQFFVQRDERPFFLYFCPTDPHRYKEGFANEPDYPGVRRVAYDPAQVAPPPFLPDQPEVRSELAEYYQAVSRADQGLGSLFAALRETGHWDDTLILVLSDNGIPFPGAKTTLYEPGIRLPLVVRSPRHEARGAICNAMVTWADLTPTVLDFAGVNPGVSFHGRSFLGVLDQPDPPGWDEVFLSHTFHEVTMYYPMRAVRTERYKFIFNLAHELSFPFASDLYDSAAWQGTLRRQDAQYGQRTVEAYVRRPRHELYDLEADPGESVNLAESPEHAALVADFQARVRAWQERTGDPWVVKYTHE